MADLILDKYKKSDKGELTSTDWMTSEVKGFTQNFNETTDSQLAPMGKTSQMIQPKKMIEAMGEIGIQRDQFISPVAGFSSMNTLEDSKLAPGGEDYYVPPEKTIEDFGPIAIHRDQFDSPIAGFTFMNDLVDSKLAPGGDINAMITPTKMLEDLGLPEGSITPTNEPGYLVNWLTNQTEMSAYPEGFTSNFDSKTKSELAPDYENGDYIKPTDMMSFFNIDDFGINNDGVDWIGPTNSYWDNIDWNQGLKFQTTAYPNVPTSQLLNQDGTDIKLTSLLTAYGTNPISWVTGGGNGFSNSYFENLTQTIEGFNENFNQAGWSLGDGEIGNSRYIDVVSNLNVNGDQGGLWNNHQEPYSLSFRTINVPTLDDIVSEGNLTTGTGYPILNEYVNAMRQMDNVGATKYQGPDGSIDLTNSVWSYNGPSLVIPNFNANHGIGTDNQTGESVYQTRTVSVNNTMLTGNQLGEGDLVLDTVYDVESEIHKHKTDSRLVVGYTTTTGLWLEGLSRGSEPYVWTKIPDNLQDSRWTNSGAYAATQRWAGFLGSERGAWWLTRESNLAFKNPRSGRYLKAWEQIFNFSPLTKTIEYGIENIKSIPGIKSTDITISDTMYEVPATGDGSLIDYTEFLNSDKGKKLYKENDIRRQYSPIGKWSGGVAFQTAGTNADLIGTEGSLIDTPDFTMVQPLGVSIGTAASNLTRLAKNMAKDWADKKISAGVEKVKDKIVKKWPDSKIAQKIVESRETKPEDPPPPHQTKFGSVRDKGRLHDVGVKSSYVSPRSLIYEGGRETGLDIHSISSVRGHSNYEGLTNRIPLNIAHTTDYEILHEDEVANFSTIDEPVPLNVLPHQQKQVRTVGNFRSLQYGALRFADGTSGKYFGGTRNKTDGPNASLGVQKQQKTPKNGDGQTTYARYGDYMTLIDIAAGSTLTTAYGQDNKVEASSEGMPVYFKDMRTGEYIIFRGYVSGITDEVSANWESGNYIGRSEAVHTYTGAERSVSFNLQAFAQTRHELDMIYKKINRLNMLCYPQYKKDDFLSLGLAQQGGTSMSKVRMRPPMTAMRLGDLYGNNSKNMKGFISSVSYSFPDESVWETIKGKRVPKMIDMAITFTVLHSTAPGLVGRNYTKSWGYSGVERTGLRGSQEQPLIPEEPLPEGEVVNTDFGSFA